MLDYLLFLLPFGVVSLIVTFAAIFALGALGVIPGAPVRWRPSGSTTPDGNEITEAEDEDWRRVFRSRVDAVLAAASDQDPG